MPPKILVVDDNQDLCENLKDVFDSEGHDTTCVYDGYEAVRSVQRTTPEIVLLDMFMPGLDGLATFRQIARLAPTARVIMMTGHIDETVGRPSNQ